MKTLSEKIKSMLELRKQILESKKRNNDGFTLLELLVVVAILAAIAGTATIALKDTDARASAAAHVTMMDELNKGIRTYRVIKRNELPSRFDSLLAEDGTDPGMLGFDPATDAAIASIPTGVLQIMYDGGIQSMMYIDNDNTDMPNGAVVGSMDCSATYIQALINSRSNMVVAGNIFLTPDANGCGVEVPFDADGDDAVDATVSGVWWIGGNERLTGQEDPAGDGTVYNADGNYAYLLTGIGPASTLFNANELGGMTTVPVYRHVKPDEYNRFIAVWNVGTYLASATGGIQPGDQCELVAIVDGALDTKEEELGEWDGTRNTI
nr:prepilin-type N-terminal cleavage/methylation domain-containing protein [uncultured Desulfobulbus sp.]